MTNALSEAITPEVGSPEWVKARRRGIGASELAAACGASKWKSRFRLWEEKTGRAPAVAENSAMKWGSRHEHWLIEDYCDRNACEIRGTQVTLKVDAGPPEIWATLDALIRLPTGEQAPLECKCTTSRNGDLGDEETDQLPLSWIAQAQAQMHAAGAEHCYFAVLVDGNQEREFCVEYDAALLEKLIAKAREFWGYVERDETPPADWADVDEKLARHKWLKDYGVPVDLRNTPAETAWLRYEGLGREIRELENDRESIKAEVIAAMGDHNLALLGDGRELVIQEITRKGYTVEEKTFFQLRARKAK